MIDKITVEGVVGCGLVIAMIASIAVGDTSLAKDIAMGLIGFIGKHVVTRNDN